MAESKGLKHEIRALVEAKVGSDVRVEFVDDGDRLDVRISNLGVSDAIETRHEDLLVSPYNEYRFTVMRR